MNLHFSPIEEQQIVCQGQHLHQGAESELTQCPQPELHLHLLWLQREILKKGVFSNCGCQRSAKKKPVMELDYQLCAN